MAVAALERPDNQSLETTAYSVETQGSLLESWRLSPVANLFAFQNFICPHSKYSTLIFSNLVQIEPVKVPHTGTSWAFVLSRVTAEGEGMRPWKVVYSGDTPRCSHLAEAGRDCDLLIHEATMGDGYEEQAIASHHRCVLELPD